VIESAGSKTGKGARHQVASQRGRPAANMRMKLVEPLRELFKTKCAD